MSVALYNLGDLGDPPGPNTGIFYGTKNQCRGIVHEDFNFAELDPPLNDPAEVNRIMELYAVSFFKVKLSGNRRYQPYLTPGYAEENEPLVDLEVTGGKGH